MVRTLGASALPTRSLVTRSSAFAAAMRPASMLEARSAVRNGFLKLTSLSLFGALFVSTDRPREPLSPAGPCAASSLAGAHVGTEYAKAARLLQRYSKREPRRRAGAGRGSMI